MLESYMVPRKRSKADACTRFHSTVKAPHAAPAMALIVILVYNGAPPAPLPSERAP